MKTLIVKEGTLGGLVRLTPLFSVLKGEIYWLTLPDAAALLPQGSTVKIINIKDFEKNPEHIAFDLVLNLEDSEEHAKLVVQLAPKRVVGAFWDEKRNVVDYTPESGVWFDLGAISRYGKKKADELKFVNRKSYQEMVFEMLGIPFNGEEYLMSGVVQQGKMPTSEAHGKIIIALEGRAGEKWPMKRWHGYAELAARLEEAGFEPRLLGQRATLAEYENDINQCDILVSGDTLAMHLGLALKKQLVTIFTCTSPWEVYDYGRMTKMISPLLEKGFYKRDYFADVVNAVTVDDVFDAVVQRAKLLKSSK
jgi:heptosyltransferase-2